MRILICEDNPDTATSLAMLLRIEGHEVQICSDGSSCVDVGREWRPDIAFVDIGMPKKDGYQVARELRPNGGNGVFLVAVTGYAKPQDVEAAHAAGFDVHLKKPAAAADIDEAVQAAQRRIERI